MNELSLQLPKRFKSSTARRRRGDAGRARRLVRRLADASGHSERSPLRKQILALGDECVPALVEALSNPAALTRWESVNLLGTLRAPETAELLVEFALSEDEVHARWRAFWAVSRLDPKTTVPRLRAARRMRNRSRRWRAALMLSVLQRPEAGAVLVEGLGSPSAWERWEALSAIKSLRLRGCEAEVARCLAADEPRHIRQEAALALGSIGTPASRKALARALSDSEPEVRWRASMAMTRFGKASLPRLKSCLKQERDEKVRAQLESDIAMLEKQ